MHWFIFMMCYCPRGSVPLYSRALGHLHAVIVTGAVQFGSEVSNPDIDLNDGLSGTGISFTVFGHSVGQLLIGPITLIIALNIYIVPSLCT